MKKLAGTDWVTVDAGYTGQIAEKLALLETRHHDVIRYQSSATAACQETLSEILNLLQTRSDFDVRETEICCPDGRVVPINVLRPLETIAALIQEDICILQKTGDEHVLTAALLCFPASWTLAEKIGKPLIAIHRPVSEYDASVAQRVQRLFDGIKVGHPIWRANFLNYAEPALFHPKTEDSPRAVSDQTGRYERSERQTLWRLPQTKAVVFAIHTTVVDTGI